jgi:hypothetical protein
VQKKFSEIDHNGAEGEEEHNILWVL